MILNFYVGVNEVHLVSFSFDKMWGGTMITVDGVPIIQQTRLFGGLVAQWDLVVGVNEPHAVHIEKHRPVFMAGFRAQPVYAWVDGVLVAQGEV
ncbi:hypothetical protein [Schumannella sp. 10F1B-5-1]|uniref:hypothetical protein n=1 Tax=Schumannella sp. 10F1B-5-1 TaxID=2590780 RepID=UPI00112FE4EB|nr:hypothetical protein [Schumannella sp. 10F1B-5-1]TPW78493.1 hypothetical protein FJ658_01490 [Schumannella sp. 10F1B-5-1]